MKTLLIIIGIAALIGVGFMLYKNSQNTVQTNNEGATTTEEEMMDHDESDMSEMEHGSDAGMEFPTVDAGIDLSVNDGAEVFNVSGANMAFSVKEIRVQEGDTVTINFTSADGFHDFVIDEFGAATERVSTGKSSSVTFVADKKGTFEYYCSVGSHRAMGMAGTLIVE